MPAAKAKKITPLRRECDMGAPIQAYLCAQGYTVRSEVKDCDITAVLDDALLVVELKRGFTTDLLIQATERQRFADSVYVALPVEGELTRRERYAKRWKGIESLLKRLELGLILVAFPDSPDAPPRVEIMFHPVADPKPRKRPKTRQVVLREIAGRASGDYNVGGSSKRKILTAYREQAIRIACCLDRHGPQSPSGLRAAHNTSAKTQNILFKDVYGWFERLDRGMYGLRPRALAEIAETYPGVAAHYTQKLDEATQYVADSGL